MNIVFSNKLDIFYGLISITLEFFYVLFLAESSKLSIFFHMYLTITRSNIQLDTVFLAKLSSLKSTYPALIQCNCFLKKPNNPIFYVRFAFIYQFFFFNMLILLLYTNLLYM